MKILNFKFTKHLKQKDTPQGKKRLRLHHVNKLVFTINSITTIAINWLTLAEIQSSILLATEET